MLYHISSRVVFDKDLSGLVGFVGVKTTHIVHIYKHTWKI